MMLRHIPTQSRGHGARSSDTATNPHVALGTVMSDRERPFDWFRFAVQFFFGALFGGLFGFYLSAHADSRSTVWLATLGGALVVGLIAGLWGDRFWESF